MATVTESQIQGLALRALAMEDGNHSSADCYPVYVQTLSYLCSLLYHECVRGQLHPKMLEKHQKLLKLAANMISKSQEHVEIIQSQAAGGEISAAESQNSIDSNSEEVSKSYPNSFKKAMTQPGNQNSLENVGASNTIQPPMTLSSQSSQPSSLPTNFNRLSISSVASTCSSQESDVTSYPSLSFETYESFAPISPLKKAEAENRRQQIRFDAQMARLNTSGRRRPTNELTSRQLQLERTKTENLEMARRSQQEYLIRLSQLAVKICNDSTVYFRHYRDQFHLQPQLQLFYRQATLYNVFHLHNQLWYQKLVSGRRSTERCLTFIMRDGKHPIVSFIHGMASRYLARLVTVKSISYRLRNDDDDVFVTTNDEDDTLDKLANDLNDELQRLAEILTLVIQHSNATIETLHINSDEAEDLLPLLSQAMFVQTPDGQRFYNHAIMLLRSSLESKMNLLKKAIALPVARQRGITEVDESFLTANQNEDIIAFSESREYIRRLASVMCPFEKLQLVNKACTAIVEACTRISGREDGRDLGADELTPLFAYVVLCWQEPEILVQCAFLERFSLGKALLGIEGYSLTSLQVSAWFCVDAMVNEISDEE